MTADEINPEGVALLVSEIVICAARDLCSKAPAADQESARVFLTAAGLADRADVIYYNAYSIRVRRQVIGLYGTPQADRRRQDRGKR